MKTVLIDTINEHFIQEWKPFDEIYKSVKNAIFNHFFHNEYLFQRTHDVMSSKIFKPYTFNQIENLLGLPYTSSSSFAALWVTNSGYLWADDTHYFEGFAVTTLGTIVAIAQDEEENEIYIKIGKI